MSWIKELKQQANSQIIMVLAGNKADMAAEKRAISREVNFVILIKKTCIDKQSNRLLMNY